jgi:uncharacterized protein YpmS
MTRRDPDFQYPEPDKPGFDWRKWLTFVVIALLLAMAVFVLYKNVAAG